MNGEPLSGSQVPRLSGQSAYYLLKQLYDYASGARHSPVMTAYTRLMSPQQIADVALAWSQRQAPYTSARML